MKNGAKLDRIRPDSRLNIQLLLPLGRQIDRARVARERGRFGNLAVAEGAEHLEDLTPGWERSAIVPLVLVHRFHEDDFFVVVVPLAGRRVDLTPAFRQIGPRTGAPPIEGDRNIPLPPFHGSAIIHGTGRIRMRRVVGAHAVVSKVDVQVAGMARTGARVVEKLRY